LPADAAEYLPESVRPAELPAPRAEEEREAEPAEEEAAAAGKPEPAAIPAARPRAPGAGGDLAAHHRDGALALLALLQVTAVIINLLPVPGLDGFGVVEPFLSTRTLERLGPVRRWGWLVLFVLLFWTPRGSEVFWDTAGRVLDLLDVSRSAAVAGLRAFQFWVR
jgi:hypothetical protein